MLCQCLLSLDSILRVSQSESLTLRAYHMGEGSRQLPLASWMVKIEGALLPIVLPEDVCPCSSGPSHGDAAEVCEPAAI